LTTQVVIYAFFIRPMILPKIPAPHLPSSTTLPGHELQAHFNGHSLPQHQSNGTMMVLCRDLFIFLSMIGLL
jgi:hypothetical protein